MQSRIKEKLIKMHLTKVIDDHSTKCVQVIDILVEALEDQPAVMGRIMNGLKAQKVDETE